MSLKHQAAASIAWRMAETGGRYAVQLIISMILARLIAPDQFGAIAMLTIFTAVAQAFVDSGFASALTRSKSRTQEECSTVFYFNIVIAFVAYWILFFCAPLIARFYEMPILCPVLRVTAIGIIISSLSSVQNTLFAAALNFKVLAKYNVIALTISGVIGVILAYHGWQVWALVAQTLATSALTCCFLWWKSSWRPSLTFSTAVLRRFFAFGSKLLASGLLDQIYNNMYQVVIGKIFRASDLAFYNRAHQLTQFGSAMPTGILQSVTYPTLCKVQDDMERLSGAYRSIIRVSTFVIFPLCLGIGAVAYPLVNLMFSSTWIYAATLLQILAFSGMWYPVHAINLNLLIVKGRSDLFLRLEIVKKIVGVTTLCITVPLGLEPMCYGMIATSIIALFINTYYTGKIINLSIWHQLRDFAPQLGLSLAMFVVCHIITRSLGQGWVSLGAGVAAGVAFYVTAALALRLPEVKMLINLRK